MTARQFDGATVTAEIAVMNKNAIALAADSAVTIVTDQGHKIFNTAEKLFSLSKYRPVGIMVYDTATFMGIPWESIIKVYRSSLGKRSFRTLKEYANDFLMFLGNSKSLFPTHLQAEQFEQRTAAAFRTIVDDITKSAEAFIKANGKASPAEIAKIAGDEIESVKRTIRAEKILPNIRRNYLANLKRRHSSKIRKIREYVFENIPVSRKHSQMLLEIAIQISVRNIFPFQNTGVVVAGFGETEIFPSAREYEICSVLDGVLKFRSEREATISVKTNASILAFAQRDMVAAFMEGVDPTYRLAIYSYLGTVLEHYPVELLKQISGISQSTKQSLTKRFQKIRSGVLEDFRRKTKQFSQENHVNPVVRAISVLSKDMLADVAEALVSLTSFKRRISMNAAETVGGPIDVAVISRGDGFVWIKRKHYFKPEFNPHFLKNYFGEHDEKS